MSEPLDEIRHQLGLPGSVPSRAEGSPGSVPPGTSFRPSPEVPNAHPRRGRSPVGLLLLAAALIGLVIFGINRLSDARSPTQPATSLPCPRSTVSQLAGTTEATLTDHLRTDTYEVYICSVPARGLYYSAYQRADEGIGITLPAARRGSAYVATNGSYVYRVDSIHLVVQRSGQTVLDQPVLQQPSK